MEESKACQKCVKGKEILSVQIGCVVGLGLVQMSYFIGLSFMPPFFSKEAEFKGVGQEISWIIFIVNPVTQILVAPFLGKLVAYIGARRLFYLGLSANGVSNIIFGFFIKIESGEIFLISCVLARGISAIGPVSMGVAVLYFMEAFPNGINKPLGFQEIFTGLGTCFGPTIGGILYDFGGFSIPFWFLGALVLSLIPVCVYCLPPLPDEAKHPESNLGLIWKLIKCPVISLNLFVSLIYACGLSFLQPILEPQLRKDFGVSSSTIGLMFLVLAICYMATNALIGIISDHLKCTWILTFVGSCGIGLAILLLDPTALINFPKILWLKFVSLGLIGMFAGVGWVPAFGATMREPTLRGLPDNSITYSTLAGLWNAVFSVGDTAGTSFGAIITEFYGFGFTCGMTSILFIATAALYFSYFAKFSCHRVTSKTDVVPMADLSNFP